MARKHSVTTPETPVGTPVESATAETVQVPEQTTAELMESSAEPAASAESPSVLSQLLPTVGESVSKVVYGSFYYASYGVVFGALTLARLIPMDNVMGRAIKDGAADARQALEEAAAVRSTQEAPATSEAVASA